MKEAFPVKPQTDNLCFCLKVNYVQIKQNPERSYKEYNAIFEYIHQNIRGFLRSKNICIDQ